MFPSRQPVMMYCDEDDHDNLITPSSCWQVNRGEELCSSQTISFPSMPPVATHGKPGENPTHSTEPEWPVKELTTFPVLMFTTWTVLSVEPLATNVESELMHKQVSPSVWYGCPFTTWTLSPDFGFHIRKAPSAAPVQIIFPSGVKSPQVTDPLWPVKTERKTPLSAFHIQLV
eukprot:Gb_31138 [translate_table: standard]